MGGDMAHCVHAFPGLTREFAMKIASHVITGESPPKPDDDDPDAPPVPPDRQPVPPVKEPPGPGRSPSDAPVEDPRPDPPRKLSKGRPGSDPGRTACS